MCVSNGFFSPWFSDLIEDSEVFFCFFFFFFFQAEDGIRDRDVTGVQTCALPILQKRSAVLGPFVIIMCHGK